MLRLLADENLNNNIVHAIQQRLPDIDIVRVQDVGLMGSEDPELLEWAATHDRVLLTHDVTTMTKHASDRLARGEPVTGVFEIKRLTEIGRVVDDIELLFRCGDEDDWRGQIKFIPLA